MRRISMRWLLMIAVVLGSTAARADLIVNGGFEVPATTGTGATFSAGDTSITGWTIVAGTVDVVNQSFFAPFEGRQALDLDGVSAGTIEQRFATTAGGSYLLGFEYANNPLGATGLPSAIVSLTGVSSLFSQAITHTGSSPAAMNYTLFTASFTADSASTTLRFTSLDTSGSVNGVVFDAVSVNPRAVPEPGSLVLLGSGLFGLMAIRYRAGRARRQAA